MKKKKRFKKVVRYEVKSELVWAGAANLCFAFGSLFNDVLEYMVYFKFGHGWVMTVFLFVVAIILLASGARWDKEEYYEEI